MLAWTCHVWKATNWNTNGCDRLLLRVGRTDELLLPYTLFTPEARNASIQEARNCDLELSFPMFPGHCKWSCFHVCVVYTPVYGPVSRICGHRASWLDENLASLIVVWTQYRQGTRTQEITERSSKRLHVKKKWQARRKLQISVVRT